MKEQKEMEMKSQKIKATNNNRKWEEKKRNSWWSSLSCLEIDLWTKGMAGRNLPSIDREPLRNMKDNAQGNQNINSEEDKDMIVNVISLVIQNIISKNQS